MKTIILIVAMCALTGCKSTPSLAVTPEGIGLSLAVCPDSGECFVFAADMVPEGFIELSATYASPVDGFLSK